ncbi:MAG: hypothetical protein BWK74_06560 [Desulfobacteraceae bacterium A6]|nr:MAG: hypothetical protein BWK74_06560 [Desulfobacteraceae bacterium A6]
MKKVEQTRSEKMRIKECFNSLQPCDRQPDQNDTDEPPSLFMPINAGTGLNRLFEPPSCPDLISQYLPVFSLSKNSLFQTPVNGTLFSTPLRGRKTQEIIYSLLKTKTMPVPASADDCFKTEGFIISRRSKITVTLKCRDRHKEP